MLRMRNRRPPQLRLARVFRAVAWQMTPALISATLCG
jgi:hypothetical protein